MSLYARKKWEAMYQRSSMDGTTPTPILTRRQYNDKMEAASRKIRNLTKTAERLKEELDAALARHQIAESYQKIVENQCKRRC